MTHTAAFDAGDLDAPAPAESGGWLLEAVVHVSIVTVIVALGVALRTSLGFGLVSSIVTALTIYWALLLIHALVRRGRDVASLSAEMADLEDENAELRRMVEARRSAAAPREPGRRADGPAAPVLPGLGAPTAAGHREGPKADMAPGAPKVAASAKAPVRAPEPALQPPAKAAVGTPLEPAAKHAPPTLDKPRPELTAKPAVAAPAVPPVPPAAKRSPGKTDASPAAKAPASPAPAAQGTPFAPGGPRVPPPLPAGRAEALALGIPPAERRPTPDRAPAARPSAPPPPMPAAEPTLGPPLAEREPAMGEASVAPGALDDPRAQDIAIMQSLIKGLADQLNAPAAPPAARAGAPHELPMPPEVAEAPDHALHTVDGQVGALRDVATALRGPESGPAASARDRGVLAQIAGAVDAARIDVYLDPILGLDDRKARHFEVSVRLRNEAGELLDPRDFAPALRGTGLAPRIEAHTFTETIRLAGQFAARGADASLFSSLSGESLRDGDFHDALAGALTPDVTLASRLVMSVAQSEVRAFGPAHWDALAAMAQTGLRYALTDVVDLDVDFEGIKRRGFDFVRLDAQVFLDGLPSPHGVIPAADLCRYLSRLGFSLIVGRIADERELVKVLGFGALLGQGQLFGAPRPVKVEHTSRRPSAA